MSSTKPTGGHDERIAQLEDALRKLCASYRDTASEFKYRSCYDGMLDDIEAAESVLAARAEVKP